MLNSKPIVTRVGATVAALTFIAGCGSEFATEEASSTPTELTDTTAAGTDAPADTEAPTGTEAPAATEAPAPTAPPAPAATEAPAPTAPPAPAATPSQQKAIRAAEDYLDVMPFSRQGLIDQLSSEYGSGFPVEDATFAVDNVTADWLAEAVEAATSYIDTMAFSCQGLIEQLSSEYGSQFTPEQAAFGAQSTGIC